MRDKVVLLNSFEDIKILYQYLYMSEDNFIIINNKLGVPLKIYMDENLTFQCVNMHLSSVSAMNYSSEMSIKKTLYLITLLKKQPAQEFPKRFENRWEEIKGMCMLNLSANIGL